MVKMDVRFNEIVRVGGGYVIIDEFLDQFLPVELEKIGKGGMLKFKGLIL
jgi:hypothetical protein